MAAPTTPTREEPRTVAESKQDTEQQDVSLATAGGAPAPDVAAPIEEVPPHPAYVENAVAGALTDMYGFLPLSVRYGAAAAAQAAVESWQRMTGPAAVPDPHDAELERLRGELAKANTGWEVWRDEQRSHDKRRDNELRVVAERLHELIGDTEPCAMAFISARHLHGLLDRVVAEPPSETERLKLEVASARSIADEKRAVAEKLRGEVERLETQRDQRQSLWQARYGQLIGGALAVQQHLQRAHGQPETAVTSEYMGPDFSRSMVDGLRYGKERAECDLERANEQAIKATNERNEARTERDRLRQELDRVAAQEPKAVAERDILAEAMVTMQGILKAADERLAGEGPAVEVVGTDV